MCRQPNKEMIVHLVIILAKQGKTGTCYRHNLSTLESNFAKRRDN